MIDCVSGCILFLGYDFGSSFFGFLDCGYWFGCRLCVGFISMTDYWLG